MSIARIGTGLGGFGGQAHSGDRRQAFRRRFRVGDVVRGVVIRPEGEHLARVRLDDLEVLAEMPFAARAGQWLAARVEALEPEIRLTCLHLLEKRPGFDMAAYFAARRLADGGDEEAAGQLRAMRQELGGRLALPVAWEWRPPRQTAAGEVRACEAAAWAEPGTALSRCVASAELAAAGLAPVRLFLEGQAKPPQMSYTLFAPAGYDAHPLREEALAALLAAAEAVLPALVPDARCLRRRHELPPLAEVALFLAKKFG